MQKTNFLPYNLSFFGEDAAADTVAAGTEETAKAAAKAADEPAANTSAQDGSKTNYEELYTTDKGFQSFVDKTVTKATQTAVENAIKKQQRLADEKISESEKLQQMNDREKAAYFERKLKDLERQQARQKEIDGLKTQTVSMLTENAIPDVFLDVFNFTDASSEDIKRRVDMLAEYEYYPKGTFKKAVEDGVTAAVNAKLKQTQPTANGGDAGAKAPAIPAMF